MFPRPRSIIKFPDSARNRNPEEYKGTVFYRTFVLLAPFYNSGTRCSRIWPVLVEQMESSASAPWAWKVWNLETIWNNIALYYIILHLICSKGSSPFFFGCKHHQPAAGSLDRPNCEYAWAWYPPAISENGGVHPQWRADVSIGTVNSACCWWKS